MGALKTSKKRIRMRLRLKERDGEGCWFCGRILDGDETIEHLVPESLGGKSNIENLVLAHQHCNQTAGRLGLGQKFQLRWFVQMLTKLQGSL